MRRNSLSIPLMTNNKLYDVPVGDYGYAASEEMIRRSLKENESIIVDVDYVKKDNEEYYIVYLIDEDPVDLEHWSSVEKLFEQLNFTANWVNEDHDRPASDKIRWVEDGDDLENVFYTTRSQFA